MALPQHIAVIMDGNGRWATARGLPRTEGHRVGVEAADAVVTRCRELGVGFLTLYTFSRENWSRPRSEVMFLFDLLVRFLTERTSKMERNGVRLNLYGDASGLPMPARLALESSMRRTAGCTGMTVNLALNYSGRDELVRAARRMLEAGVGPESVTEATLAGMLYSAGQPDPDLIIRTGGEHRLSNFLPFQSAYSELYFTDVLWPDFDADALDGAIAWYRGRERRFGMTSEQVKEHA